MPEEAIYMSLTKRGKHSWRFECYVNGKRYTKSYYQTTETQQEIQKIFETWRSALKNGKISKKRYLFSDFSKEWIENYCTDFSPLVVRSYMTNLKNWILPEFGKLYIDEITPIMIDAFINKLKRSTTIYQHRENHQLSNGTIEAIYKVVRTILTLAYKKGVIDSNPCDRVTLILRREIVNGKLHYWDAETYRKVLQLLEKQSSEYAAAVEFALKTGLRRSEMFGLKWGDINFEESTISINRTRQKVRGEMVELPCKTASSVREICVPRSLLEKISLYKGNEEYVFGDIDCDSVTAWYRAFVKKSGFPQIRFHDLRHTHATLLLYKGIDIKTISERLGHSNIGTTMNTYTHVMKELDRKCALAIENI